MVMTMVVYELVRTSFNGCDTFENGVGLFFTEESAEVVKSYLEETNTDPDVSYFIREREVQ